MDYIIKPGQCNVASSFKLYLCPRRQLLHPGLVRCCVPDEKIFNGHHALE